LEKRCFKAPVKVMLILGGGERRRAKKTTVVVSERNAATFGLGANPSDLTDGRLPLLSRREKHDFDTFPNFVFIIQFSLNLQP
jgi:hypothetical protein